MSLNNPLPGYNLASEFLGAGTAFITSSNMPSSSIVKIDFPTVAKSVTISNNDPVFANTIDVATTVDDILNTGKSYNLNGNRKLTLKAKTNQIYLRSENLVTSSYSVAASLSNVPRYFAPAEDFTWTPVTLAPQLWLRSDLGVTLNGTTVSQWNDQSGNGNNVAQASEIRQPTFISNLYNNRPGMWYGFPTSTANTRKLVSTLSSFSSTANFDWYIVTYATQADITALQARNGSIAYAATIDLSSATFTNNYIIMSISQNADTRTRFYVGGTSTFLNGTNEINRPVLMCMNRTATTPRGFRDNTGTSLTQNANAVSARPIGIGGIVFNDSQPHCGSIIEVVTFNRYLTQTERTNLLAYFSNRYNQLWTQ
jgi:hypothetical protein